MPYSSGEESEEDAEYYRREVMQAVVIADTFEDEFVPICDDIPFALLPVVNQPLIDYTLESIALGGVKEVFVYSRTHVEAIQQHIDHVLEVEGHKFLWMDIRVIPCESCHSLGDCLRDIDSKGLIREKFILVGPGAMFSFKIIPIIKKHTKTMEKDKGCAMTLIYHPHHVTYMGINPKAHVLIGIDSNERIVYHGKFKNGERKKHDIPVEVFLDNPQVTLRRNIRDTTVAICSPSVLSLFSDNFDFQTPDDFVKGILMNEEILGNTVYCHFLTGGHYGNAVTDWRMYQAVSYEIMRNLVYPVNPSKENKIANYVCRGKDCVIDPSVQLSKCVIGPNVVIGKNVVIKEAFILSNTKVDDGAVITHSVIGSDSHIKSKAKVTAGSILGRGVVIKEKGFVENSLVQATEPKECDSEDKLGEHAFRIRTDEDDDEIGAMLAIKFLRMRINDTDTVHTGDEVESATDSEEELSNRGTPVPVDTELFFTEVIDSLTRGFEDQLQCENLILEINSSRYAYNVTVKEVNFNVIKAILHMSLRWPIGPQYFSQFVRLLSYFFPILKNYIRNKEAMRDALQAIQDVAISNETVTDKWVKFVLKWFYDKDLIAEEEILEWSNGLDVQSRFHSHVKPFTDWLREAEEESTSESSVD